ncbi:ABC transporter permease [Hyunsoonleella sp. SJ7]|uniref:ABC transporter permease n=1 Tax=Hyunsoonleella aquatilis TaxID=2762758 RepID=A0A923HH81_9FLAO|nr:ABC transporter permease [Hyunsoonleella aquatilis]MBC3758342.1 ABC transporter permease [Hyunsoonleella aquatilis]
MISNYLKIALRNFKKETFFTTINMVGLVLGFSACILILGYLNFETSYENHIEKADSVYRVVTIRHNNKDLVYEGAKGPNRLAQVAPEEIPGINYASRTYREKCLIRTDDKKIANQSVFWVDKDFLKIFKGLLIEGNPDTALDSPLKMVISESKARALFGNKNPIGERVKVNEGMPFVITGIVKDAPKNTHLKYDYLNSLQTFVHYGWMEEEGNWNNNYDYNYVSLDASANPQSVTNSLNQLAKKYVNPEENGGRRLAFKLQPIKDIHLTSNYADEFEINGSLSHIYIILGIGIAILVIVFINFINLNISLILNRVKNIGIRKTIGASKNQLRMQYLTEIFLLNLLALVLSIFITVACHPFLEQLFQVTLSFSFIYIAQFWLYAMLFFVFCIVCIGFYPSVILASFNPITAIKGKIVNGQSNNNRVKRILLSIQFSASIFLTIGAVIVYQQINFMLNSDLGIDTEQVLVMQGPTTLNVTWNDEEQVANKKRRFKRFKEELLKMPSVRNVASCLNVPGEETMGHFNEITVESTGENIQGEIKRRAIDENFFSVYNAKFLAGKNFEPEIGRPKRELIINEKTSKLLGFKHPENAINQIIKRRNRTWKIIGVVADFHVKSLSEPIAPVCFINRHPFEFGYYLAKLNTKDISKSLDMIESKWKSIYPEDPFVTYFSDTYFNKQYAKYQQFGSIFNALTLLAIIIANLGLIAMVSLTVTEKLKEIAVRRILGANSKTVFALISKNFLILIAIASFIAVPLAWYLLKIWLNNFAYQIELKSISFLAPVVVILLISTGNMMYFVLKILRYNPATILREE